MMKKPKIRIALLQPLIPHYRESFFKALAEKYYITFYTVKRQNDDTVKKINHSALSSICIKNKIIAKKINIYNILPFLMRNYEILILPNEIRSLSTWVLLVLRKFSKNKTILWGHGISIKHYLKEKSRYPVIRIIFNSLADQVWLYTDNEKKILKKHINENKLITITNTIDTRKIWSLKIPDIRKIKKQYQISDKINFIYSARFSTPQRRADLLEKIIQRLDKNKYGFIIIGDGQYKPDLEKYTNVHDFGALYDDNLKSALFNIADLYLQPAWIGLSGVEALAYGKPILTLKRSHEILQCVEYGYIRHLENGFIANDIEELIHFIENINHERLLSLQQKSLEYAKRHLGIENMILAAENGLKQLEK